MAVPPVYVQLTLCLASSEMKKPCIDDEGPPLGLSEIYKKCSDQHARARSVVYEPKSPFGTLSRTFYSAN